MATTMSLCQGDQVIAEDLCADLEDAVSSPVLINAEQEPDPAMDDGWGTVHSVTGSNPRSAKTFLATNVALRAFGMPQ
jgi:hypothetical protein